MGAVNPFLGGAPMMPQTVGGAVPSGGDEDGATAVIGAVGSGPAVTRSTPATLGGLVLLCAAVIVVIHIAGVRTHFTVSAGK